MHRVNVGDTRRRQRELPRKGSFGSGPGKDVETQGEIGDAATHRAR
jgi:hypothetical protein